MTREELLEIVKTAVCKDRQETYGTPEDSFQNITDFWNTYLVQRGFIKQDLEPKLDSTDIAVMMMLLKISRIIKSPQHIDNWVDVAGYAACGAEIVNKT